MTTTSVKFEDIWLIDQDGFRDMEASGELDIEFVSANRWQITAVRCHAWTDQQPYTRGLVSNIDPAIDYAIRHKIMTSHSWCEHISEHIASEMKQDRALMQPFNKWVMA